MPASGSLADINRCLVAEADPKALAGPGGPTCLEQLAISKGEATRRIKRPSWAARRVDGESLPPTLPSGRAQARESRPNTSRSSTSAPHLLAIPTPAPSAEADLAGLPRGRAGTVPSGSPTGRVLLNRTRYAGRCRSARDATIEKQ